MKKIRSKKGESIAETMIAMLVVSMALTMLAGAIVTAARVNSREKNEDEVFLQADAEKVEDQTYSITIGSISIPVDVYKTSKDYYYYE